MASGASRHSARHNKGRTKAALPKNATEQRRLLRWLLQQESNILEHGDERQRAALAARGLRTNPKRFYDTEPLTAAQRAMHSRALRSLARRGLLLLPHARREGEKSPPASLVRLTPIGRHVAQQRTMEEQEEHLKRLFESGEIRLPPALANLTIRTAPNGKALLTRLVTLQRDTKALRALIRKHAPDSPALPRLSKLIEDIEEVEDSFLLVGTATPETVACTDQRLAANAAHTVEAAHRLALELRDILSPSNP